MGLLLLLAWVEAPSLFAEFGRSSEGLAFPANGTVAYPAGKAPPAATSRFSVKDESEDGRLKVVRFRAPDASEMVAELYLHPGQSGEVELRPGIYRLHISSGRNWLGPDAHFGLRSEVHDFGTHAVGGSMAGVVIKGKSPVGNAAPISSARF